VTPLACPTCCAEPGYPCVTLSGSVTPRPHARRSTKPVRFDNVVVMDWYRQGRSWAERVQASGLRVKRQG
jgi:hypothetical protein